MDEPARSRLRPASSSGLTSPDPVTPTQRPLAPADPPPDHSRHEPPDTPQNSKRQENHAPASLKTSPGNQRPETDHPNSRGGSRLSELDPDHPGKRFATDGHRAYCGHEHSPDCWHGFPVEWRKVPAKLRNTWLADGRISKRSVREPW
jgi:hypothetical protein